MDIQQLSRVSRSMYSLLDMIIGSEEVIDVRRTATNLRDELERICIESTWLDDHDGKSLPCFSGSKAEGLRFRSSDDDWMFIYQNIKVIPSDSFMTIYDNNTTLLLMENEMTKPGFTLLRIIGGRITQRDVRNSMEYILNGHYLSCKKWRELHTAKAHLSNEDFTHGPCASGIVYGVCEYDLAFCLRCEIWPANAQDCIRRMHRCGWPSHDNVRSILKDGVLFVPIGAKQSIFENSEWRMSFSLAEKKLVHAMNHTQFLCYGLLKIFLKQAIDVNPEVKGLLCSYFLKTALFWEITTTSNQWNPSTLLSCFWNCFRRIVQWISCSYCPNFFNPENNMFEGKIEGTNREKLLQFMRTLYQEGFRCLLRCKWFSSLFNLPIMRWPYIELPPKKLSNCEIAVIAKYEWIIGLTTSFIYSICSRREQIGIKCLALDKLASTSNSSHLSPVKYWLYHHLIQLGMVDSNYISDEGSCNKQHYQNHTERMNVLQRCRPDIACHFLYQTMLCHNNGRYNKALRLIQKCKEKISAPGSMSLCELKMEHNREAGGDNVPLETMLKRHVFENMRIFDDHYIPELYIECHARDVVCNEVGFDIPPLACAFFLQYLCQRKLGCLQEANEALYELSLLVKHGNEKQLCQHNLYKAHHILGICQQMSGDNYAACNSYLKALQNQNFNVLRIASCVRLLTILVNYF